MDKSEVQKRVTAMGVPLDMGHFQWDEEKSEFKSRIDGLFIDMRDIPYARIFADNKCIIKVGHGSTVICGDECMVVAGHSSHVSALNYSILDLSRDCVASIGDDSTCIMGPCSRVLAQDNCVIRKKWNLEAENIRCGPVLCTSITDNVSDTGIMKDRVMKIIIDWPDKQQELIVIESIARSFAKEFKQHEANH